MEHISLKQTSKSTRAFFPKAKADLKVKVKASRGETRNTDAPPQANDEDCLRLVGGAYAAESVYQRLVFSPFCFVPVGAIKLNISAANSMNLCPDKLMSWSRGYS